MPEKRKSDRQANAAQGQLKWPLIAGLIIILVVLAGFFLHAYMFLKAPELPTPPLKDLAAGRGVQLGMLAYTNRLDDKPYRQILASQYAFLTADGPIHWDTARPSPTTYDFADMDKLVAFAQANHLGVQGHHLVWDEADSLPGWLKQGQYTPDQLRELMHEHIKTVVGHYRGKVSSWTVANEAFSRAQHLYGLSDWWAEHLGGGTGYIDDAFVWARQADPHAKLLLNDFDDETKTSVSDAMYAYIKFAKTRGIPIDGVGMQLHVHAENPPDKRAMIQNMRRFGALGVPVYITEFDIDTNGVKADSGYKSWLENRITADVVGACAESNSCVSFNVFGMTDKQSLLKIISHTKSRSYLFTSRYEPKASFYSFRAAWNQP